MITNNATSKFYQGKYTPRFPEKYKGNIMDICYRSSWERKMMKWCDLNENVLQWSSETTVIRYFYPVDRKWHRYFVDFWMKMRQIDGTIKEFLVEVKPYNQTIPPKPQQKKTSKYLGMVNEYIKNDAKWKFAKIFCENEKKLGKNIDFVILTEKDLPL